MAAILSLCAWVVGVGTGLTAAAIWASLARPAFVCYAVRARGIDAYVFFFIYIIYFSTKNSNRIIWFGHRRMSIQLFMCNLIEYKLTESATTQWTGTECVERELRTAVL